ncbi:hypothetical protein RYX45_05725 [Alkalihalophilus pseudofirmus]|uniref:Uncharacterized protein n=1 Tax=Alkalihalophilus pseudofirmus TaxID=79885 RepID=A0AAJ2KZC9_ALKPS|nr:hypothetical protein [Alkalihalophilus pseudofirmus]MDV2884668.1 hypothetical protein [Alkalihalophilus pseudofirmus]
MKSRHDRILLYIVCLLFPFIGVLLALIWLGEKDSEKKKMGKICLLMAIASFPFYIVFTNIISIST